MWASAPTPKLQEMVLPGTKTTTSYFLLMFWTDVRAVLLYKKKYVLSAAKHENGEEGIATRIP